MMSCAVFLTLITQTYLFECIKLQKKTFNLKLNFVPILRNNELCSLLTWT